MTILRKKKIIAFFVIGFSLTYLFAGVSFSQTNNEQQELDQTEDIRAEFGNWLQVCAKDTDKCVAVQFALNVEGEKAARVVVERLIPNYENSSAEAVVTVFFPFESSIPVLPNGLSFKVDGNEPFLEQFLFCDQTGCTSQFGITEKGVSIFREGANLTIQLTDIRYPNSTFIVDLDLNQFANIYDILGVNDSN